MNIQEAKQQIKESVSIYLMKDEFGTYRIPLQEQRPIFMVGAPGIGKTAIMAQIAEELDISLISYSMTHHTRQSALGLPYIAHKTYQGKKFEVSEYTLSEILASVYENMEVSGKQEGILFLDEINCVSETLGPSMLQFLQYKTFGNHSLPQGWAVVTAGNPQEYNRAVHVFDVATMDRLRILEVEPDYQVWKTYADERDIHPAVRSYLDIRSEDFYSMENSADGREYVTARGWEDLSVAISLYEEKGYPVDEVLIRQYLHSRRIAGSFAVYYELFSKYRSDYQVDEILAGDAPEHIVLRMKQASFDEEISVAGLLLEKLQPRIRRNMENEQALKGVLNDLRQLKQEAKAHPAEVKVTERLKKLADEIESRMQKEINARGISEAGRRICLDQIQTLRQASRSALIARAADANEAFAIVQSS
ncbi:MAG: AAA family ATPase, partial [Erysipelotrichia bacterium]|nr:AAA family ATPase [Erysipelotrichia bacterium]